MKKLKLLFIVSFLVCVGLNGFAQDADEPDYTEKAGSTKGMGGPLLSFSSIHGNFALLMGGGGGVMIKDFTIGVYGMGQASQIEDWNNSNKYISIWHGGLWLGYTILSGYKFHPVVDVMVGLGNFSTYAQNDYSSLYTEKAGIYVVSPRLGVEFNASGFVRIGVGAEYKYVGFTKPNTSFSAKDLSALGAYFTLKLGEF